MRGITLGWSLVVTTWMKLYSDLMPGSQPDEATPSHLYAGYPFAPKEHRVEKEKLLEQNKNSIA